MRRLVKVAIAAAAMVLAATLAGQAASPASATFRGAPGKIALSEGEFVISVDPATGQHRRVVAGGGPYTPDFLPDGRRIAYVNGNAGSIWIRSLWGPTNRHGRRVVQFPFQHIRALAVGPHGLIVFSAVPRNRDIRGNSIEIYSVHANGTGLRQLTNDRVFENDPAVSPDGRTIVYVKRVDGRGQLFAMDAGGRHKRRLTRDGDKDRAPSFSPNGRQIAFFSRMRLGGSQPWKSDEIFTIGLQGGKRHRITHDRIDESDPVWSPNGRSVGFLRGDYELWIMRPSGSAQRHVYTSRYGGGIQAPAWGVRPRGR